MSRGDILLADVGGTNTRICLVDRAGEMSAPAHLQNADYPDFDALLRAYLDNGAEPCAAALAVAGPVTDNTVTMTNLGWKLSGLELAHTHGLQRVDIINDFAAQAWATSRYAADDIHMIGGGQAVAQGNRGILGPGTGLGVSSLVYNGHRWMAVAGEGGHVSLAANTQQESELIRSVIAAHGHCSAERLLSGPGLVLIYGFLGGEHARPAEVTQRALAGESKAVEAFHLFGALLGTVAADLALTVGATGGIYLAGGILPETLELFEQTPFRERFESKGRFGDYLAAIPTNVIMVPDPGLLGLAAYVA